MFKLLLLAQIWLPVGQKQVVATGEHCRSAFSDSGQAAFVWSDNDDIYFKTNQVTIVVNQVLSGKQEKPEISYSNGKWLVLWEDDNYNGNKQIAGRLIKEDGTFFTGTMGNQFIPFNTAFSQTCFLPRACPRANGNWLIVGTAFWQQDIIFTELVGPIIASPIYTASQSFLNQYSSDIAEGNSGKIHIIYDEDSAWGTKEVIVRTFTPDGSNGGIGYIANSNTTILAETPRIVANKRGHVVFSYVETAYNGVKIIAVGRLDLQDIPFKVLFPAGIGITPKPFIGPFDSFGVVFDSIQGVKMTQFSPYGDLYGILLVDPSTGSLTKNPSVSIFNDIMLVTWNDAGLCYIKRFQYQ